MHQPDRLTSALTALERALTRIGAQHMIIGGIAVIARGVPRLTRDIDVTVRGMATPERIASLAKALRTARFVPRIDDAESFARENQVLLLVHRPTGVDVDLSFAWLPFEEEALENAEPVAVGRVKVPMARPEDLIVYKAIAWRERDRDDIERLLDLYGEQVDLDRVRARVSDLLHALEDHDRFAEFERLISRISQRW